MSKYIFLLKGSSVLFFLLLVSNVLYAENYSWRNDAASSSWEDPLNWSGTAAVPVNGSNQVVFRSTDNITIGTTSAAPVLNSNQTIGALTLSISSLTINSGFVLDIKGSTTINGGAGGILGTGTVNIGTSTNPVAVTFGSISSGTTVFPLLNIFTNALTLYKTEFKGVLNLTNLSTGTSITGGNTYYENVYFTASGSGSFRIANGNVSGVGETFKKDLSIKVIAPAIGFEASYNYPCFYNGNLILENTTGSYGIRFGTGGGTSELAAGATISVPSFSAGMLYFNKFKQVGSTPQSFILNGTSSLTIDPNTEFNGALTCEAPLIVLNGGTFGSEVKLKHTGNSNSISIGNVLFNADFTLENSGTAACYLAPYTGNNYQFKGNSTFINSSTGSIHVAYNTGSISSFTGTTKIENIGSTGTITFCNNGGACIFNGNIEMKSSSTGNFYIGYTGTVDLGPGVKVFSTPNGFTKGTLYLSNITQQDATSQNISITGTSTLTFNGNSNYKGSMTCEAPLIILLGNTFESEVKLKNTGNGNNNSISTGNVVFNGDFTFENSGSGTCFLSTYTGNNYQFKGNSTFINSSTGTIHIAYNTGSISTFTGSTKIENIGSTGAITFSNNGACTFNGDIEVKSSSSGNFQIGINGTVSLGAGVKISSPVGSFTKGNLTLSNVTQLDVTDQSIVIGGTSTLTFNGSSSYKGLLDCEAPILTLTGGTFAGVKFKNTGNSNINSLSTGNVVFNGDFTFENAGAGICYLATNAGNTYQYKGTSTFINSSTGTIALSYNAGSTSIFSGPTKIENKGSTGAVLFSTVGACTFNGDIEIKSSSSGNFYIGLSGAVTLGPGVKLTSPSGSFTQGNLILANITQQDATDLNFEITGSSTLTFGGNSNFLGAVTASSPNLNINGGTFNKSVILTKSGTVANNSSGVVTFNDDFTLNNYGALSLATQTSGIYSFKGNCTFNNFGSGGVTISHFGVTNFNTIGKLNQFNNYSTGNITIGNYGNIFFKGDIQLSNSVGTVYLGTNGGKVNLSSNTHFNVQVFSGGTLNFRNVIQEANSPEIDLNLIGAYAAFGNTNEFYSKLKITASLINFTGSKFYGPVEFIASNTTTTVSHLGFGGSIFYSDLTITNNTSRPFALATNTGDIYYGNIIANKNSTGPIQLSNYGTSEYYGNIIYNVITPNAPDAFGGNGGTSAFMGDKPQSISCN
ncbi:MAG: hypothetical protein J7604_26085, partial [Sporocytophaga sp.]|uniref:beta strand repeat-containing protein n=1 Tax=Sporocytophaga sp. TaxID=2231183 RepID=UPI001B063D83